MARNAEKAMTTLARWRAAQEKEHGGKEERRPYLATECTDLKAAEKWRVQIIREISKKVAQIQNAGLGEFRLRDLNDEINKLLREKKHWEYQIRELGGPDFLRMGPRMLDHEGREVPGNRGYKYFGAAKDLPGVRELFEHEPPPPPRRTRAELMKNIDADYYGYMDEEDGLLLAMESKKEKQLLEEEGKKKLLNNDIDMAFEEVDSDDEDISSMFSSSRYIQPPPVPTDQDIQNLILEYKKRELLETYAGIGEKQEHEDLEDLANISSSDDESILKKL
ncbi:pre-mRNA-splicing factor ISY1 homolog [Daktulosphaira vitifoliae]|uniref:pre-mRNA-splicing factor ISY1 homolog n=1 Tax=Daktulosphaira vitifoliae TaxID=58002 RepID=UPI0021AA8A56|nr:pre-mRNA-splicing factor ISY1 homolog [Daktulosphaira vitifoliae]